MKKQIGICALIAVLVLAVTCTSQLMAEDYRNKETKYITNTAFITAIEETIDINWTKAEDGTVPLTPENLEAIRVVKELYLSYAELTDLSGIEWFTGLEVLDCGGNYLRLLDVSKNTKLEKLWCYENQLRSLDVSQNTALEVLYCGSNQLSGLDVSQNTALELLDCCENQLRSLDVLQNTALEHLSCYENQLRSLDLSHNTALIELSCTNNQLSELDLSHNTYLEFLHCGSQKRDNGDVQQLTLTLTAEQRKKWDWYWADAIYKDGNNYDVRIKE